MAIRTPKIWPKIGSIAAIGIALILGLLFLGGTIQGRESVQGSVFQGTGSQKSFLRDGPTPVVDGPTPVPDEPADPPPPDEGEVGTAIDWANVSMIGASNPGQSSFIVQEAPPGTLPQPRPSPSAPQTRANDTLPQGPTDPNEPSQTIYVVQRGDTLQEISLRFGVSQSVLAAANGIVWLDLIYAGQELIIPGNDADQNALSTSNPPAEQQPEVGAGAAAAPAPSAVVDAPAEGGTSYIVQRGDFVGSISRRFGVDIGQLITVNQIPNPNYIQAGQTLIIPEANAAASDSKAPVSESVEAPPEEVPQGSQVKAIPPLQAVVKTETNEAKLYTVAFGDTLSIIAGRFGAALIDLITVNNLINPDYIYQGQELIIPQPSDQSSAVEEPSAEIAAETAAGAGQESAEPAEEMAADSKFIWPVENYEIFNYYWAYHPGLDLVVEIGSNVFASAAGTVEFSGWNGNGYGYVVIIDHGGGVKTLYAHNSELLLAEGDTVGQGQLIGLSGSSGYSTWPHVHYELIFDKYVRVNPCQYLPDGCS